MKDIRFRSLLAIHIVMKIFESGREVDDSEGVYIIPHSEASTEEIQEELEEMVENYSTSVN